MQSCPDLYLWKKTCWEEKEEDKCERYRNFSEFCLVIRKEILNFAQELKVIMAYTKDTLVISNPSSELMEVLAELRKHKLEQLEKLRNMKPEDFSRRVILS